MDKWFRKLRCLLGHQWEEATFTYWALMDSWEFTEEPAKYCKRCGKTIVPHTLYGKYSDDPCLKLKEK